MLARSIPGWERAVEEARGTLPDLEYDRAAAVELPSWPKSARATVFLVQDLAILFTKHAHASRAPILRVLQGGRS